MSLTTNPPIIGVNILSGGTSGYSGFSGIGTSGFSGVSGYSGKSGYSGISGYSGGMEYYDGSSNGESSTTTAYPTYVNKLTYTVTPVAGTYILEWTCQVANSNANNDNWVKVRDESTTYLETQFRSQSISYANSGWAVFTGFTKVTLSAVSQSFYIDYCRVAGTTYIKNAKLLLRRIA